MMPAMGSGAATWFDTWIEAASGADGFWRHQIPSDHFATSAGAGPELAEALAALLQTFPEIGVVIDIGAGDGSLLTGLAVAGAPVQLVGVDLRPRPVGLPDRVSWVTDCWDVRTDHWADEAVPELVGGLAAPALLVATEWLDDLPCRIAVRGPEGHRELTVDGLPGPPLTAADQAWVDRWWPEGDLVEVGRTRDRAWSALVAALSRVGGVALAVDYGHVRSARPVSGSLAGFGAGRPVVARPDRRTNLTAAVAVDSLTVAGERAGAATRWRRGQADALAGLLSPHRDDDPLQALAARSRRAALARSRDWGRQWWLLQHVGARGW